MTAWFANARGHFGDAGVNGHQFGLLLGGWVKARTREQKLKPGEIVALDAAGRPVFADLMFRRRSPIFVAFDVLVARGEDVRSLPLAVRKTRGDA